MLQFKAVEITIKENMQPLDIVIHQTALATGSSNTCNQSILTYLQDLFPTLGGIKYVYEQMHQPKQGLNMIDNALFVHALTIYSAPLTFDHQLCSYNIFKPPGVHRPQAGAHLVSQNYFYRECLYECVCVCLCVHPPPRL